MRQHRQFSRFVDQWLTDYRALGKTIYCRAGCAGCCLLAVHATFPEAVVIAGKLSQLQTTQLSAYISRLKHALSTLSGLKSYLKNHRQSVGPCPFLDGQNNCSIYPVRPLSCRALLSTRPAGWCTVDFSELDTWDKQAYESSLDPQVVAWPTHFVAATQDFGREMEDKLLETMQREQGWALSGNLSAMIWLEQKYQLSQCGVAAAQQAREILAKERLDQEFLLRISG